MSRVNIPIAAAALASFTAQFSATATVNRPVKLFEAGDYPDKNVTITEADLDSIVSHFNTASAAGKYPPVKTEHTSTPLDPLGEVVALHRSGKELYGVLAFSPGIHSHIADRNVSNVSIGLIREAGPDGQAVTKLTECSLVFAARVPGAGFLSPEQVASKLATFTAQGKITPAMAPSVAKLLAAPQSVQFSDGSALSVAAEVEALLNALPVVQHRGGAVPVTFSTPSTSAEPKYNLDPQQQKFLAELRGK
jgi:hypothetical protein